MLIRVRGRPKGLNTLIKNVINMTYSKELQDKIKDIKHDMAIAFDEGMNPDYVGLDRLIEDIYEEGRVQGQQDVIDSPSDFMDPADNAPDRDEL